MKATFKTLAKYKKGGTDHGIPATFSLIKKLSTNKKVNTFTATEHMKNMKSLQSRLNRIASAKVY